MKVAVFYYMRLEDKYWVLFLAALILLYAMCEYGKTAKQYAGRILYVVGYGLLSYVLVFNTPVYSFLVSRFTWLETSYYELSHIVMMVPVIAVALTSVALYFHKQDKKRVAYLMAGVVFVLGLAGDFVGAASAQTNIKYEFTDEEKQVYEMMLSHAREHGGKDAVTFWGMDELMRKSVFYEEELEPVYRNDIRTNPEKYDDGVREMHDGYQKYVEREYDADRNRDFAYAIAGLPYIHPEVDCDYVVVYRPEAQEMNAEIENL